MPASDYISQGSGALKLKGSAGVDKKQRKKKKRKENDLKAEEGDNASKSTPETETGNATATDSAEQTAKEIANSKEQGSNDVFAVGDPASNQPSSTAPQPSDLIKDGNADALNSDVSAASALQGQQEQQEASTLTPSVPSVPGKTEAQLRYEERRRKRLEERLRREGVKTHKERVEELNRYLSNLSEHHDMYVQMLGFFQKTSCYFYCFYYYYYYYIQPFQEL